MVVGLGGVGGHAFESLVRSGIENIIVVDSDTIELSNLPSSPSLSKYLRYT